MPPARVACRPDTDCSPRRIPPNLRFRVPRDYESPWSLGEDSWVLDEDELDLNDAFAIKQATGLNMRQFFVGLLGGDAHLNARILRDVLSGKETGAARDVILLNAGAAIFVSGKAETIDPVVPRSRGGAHRSGGAARAPGSAGPPG